MAPEQQTIGVVMNRCFRRGAAYVLFGLSLCTTVAIATPDSLAWKSFGELRVDRHHHKAHYIGEGRVLVVGGYTASTGVISGVRTASCEIIDVRNGRIRSAAPLAAERGVVNVVTARDGTLYVLGGDTDNGPTDLVERYDAEANAWEIVGRLARPRWQHASAFISETEILVVAGWQENACEIFDVATGRSRMVADFPWVANSLVPIIVTGQRPAFIGGRTAGPNTSNTSSAMSYDPLRNKWQSVCEFEERTVRPTSLHLQDGHALLTGGTTTEKPFVTRSGIDVVKQLYDVARIGRLAQGRQWHGMAQWSDGMVLCAGGFTDGAIATSSTEWVDPLRGEVRPGPDMNVPHGYTELVVFRDQGSEYMLVISGLNSLTSGTPLVEILEERCTQGTVPLVSSTYVTAGSALPRDSAMELTSATPFSRGAVWAKEKQDLRTRFSMLVGFRMLKGDNKGEEEDIPSDPGADGFAVVIQNEGPEALGQYGRGIGYDGIKRSIAVEFDTYHNLPVNDPNGNHIGVQSMGRLENTSRHAPPANLAFTSDIPAMKADGTTYYAFVEYASNQLRVYFNDKPSFQRPVLVRDIDIDSLIELDDQGRAWVGITSATGQSVEQHEVVQWEINGCAADATVGVSERSIAPDVSSSGIAIHGTQLRATGQGPALVAVVDCQGRVIWSDVTDVEILDLSQYIRQTGFYVVRVVKDGLACTIPWLLLR